MLAMDSSYSSQGSYDDDDGNIFGCRENKRKYDAVCRELSYEYQSAVYCRNIQGDEPHAVNFDCGCKYEIYIPYHYPYLQHCTSPRPNVHIIFCDAEEQSDSEMVGNHGSCRHKCDVCRLSSYELLDQACDEDEGYLETC